MSAPLLGHLDPAFVQMMEEVEDVLRIAEPFPMKGGV
jgi:hypothetical protein